MDNDKVAYLNHYASLLDQVRSQYDVNKVEEDIHCVSPRTIQHSSKVALVALTHGDEVIGLHLFLQLLTALLDNTLSLKGCLYLVLANRPAYLMGQRYIEADLNRAFGDNTNDKWEEKRANQIKPILDECDYIIDLHQCIEETWHPFFILPFSKDAYRMLVNIMPAVPVIISTDIRKASTISSYGWLAGKKSVTFEVGAHGFDNEQVEFGYHSILSFLKFAWAEKNDMNNQDCHASTPTYEFAYFQPYSKGDVLFSEPFKNFDDVRKGQVIAYVDEEPVSTPLSGKILLYPKKWFSKDSPIKPDGLFFILQEVEKLRA